MLPLPGLQKEALADLNVALVFAGKKKTRWWARDEVRMVIVQNGVEEMTTNRSGMYVP